MPNILQRAFNFIIPKKVVVADRNQYLVDKSVSIRSGKRFDSSHPELCSTIYSCVQLISNNISKLELNVYKKTDRGREIFHEHAWQRTLAYNPDLRLSTSKWLNYTTNKMLIEGGAFFYRSEFDINLTPKKELKALGVVSSVVQLEGEVYYKFEGLDSWIASKDLLFFPIFSRDGITPISPISALKNELDIQSGAESTISNFYRNGLFQILFMESDLDGAGVAEKGKAKEYFEKIQNEVTGSQNAFGGGLLKIPPMYKLKSIPLPDLKFLESSRFTEARISAIYNVPAWYLNINEGSASNYSKVEQQQLNFLNNCLSNITNIILAELNDKILTVEERIQGIEIDFDYSNLYTLDLESKSLYLKNLASAGAISPNEIRQQYGYPKIDNEFMDCHFLQSQNQIIEKYDLWGNNKMNSQPNNNPV
jgi:HK97 family phage portal protein